MLSSIFILIVLSLFLGTGVWLVFVWAVKKGEFDDVEGPKFRMLDEEEGTGAIEDKEVGNEDSGRKN
ncbi:hypothetical protein DESUT3_04850 [Desulfuromonas versatilis]|uniref:Cytochrome oxidase maturation protein, cbb3-type n=1 Tax=Desulfuromonas versatilis TaxID=2802975 RepID=A0ABN6DW83_9BACT|nr:cbb3-type cytochrome oxidase assembly protein CcoS [Desulfuromonas versatilis]BCR03416.1 hypothetical protein DESUT3_04850 [Desulfuromonas versatilis]